MKYSKTNLMNKYRREAQNLGQRSPFRQMKYIEARIKGKSKEKALAISRATVDRK